MTTEKKTEYDPRAVPAYGDGWDAFLFGEKAPPVDCEDNHAWWTGWLERRTARRLRHVFDNHSIKYP